MRKISEKQVLRDFERLSTIVKEVRTPQSGWVRQIRQLLFMSAESLARRCGLERSTVSRLERSEQKRSITLASLDRLADGLNCDVKYILVPREPIDQFIDEMAHKAAEKEVDKVSHTMALEDQALSENIRKLQVDDLAAEMVRKKSPLIWES